jgi:hypothetical protein
MSEAKRSIYWEAPEHNHIEKTADWYWVLGILAIAASVASIIFDNTLFGILILLAAMTMFITGNKHPRVIPLEVSLRGIRIDTDLYPYATLESFYIDEENHTGPQLLVKSKKLFVPLLILPIPEEYVADIENIVASRIMEEHLEEPLSHKIMEFVGF